MGRRERVNATCFCFRHGLAAGVPWVCAFITCFALTLTAAAQATSNSSEDSSSALFWREASKHWGSDAVTPVHWIVIAAGILLTFLGLLLVVRWWHRRHLRSHPWGVFHHVAGAVGLSWSDRWLLMRIARQQKLPTPLTLVLSGRTLRMHGRAFAAVQPPWRRAVIMQRVASIRRDLFGQLGAEPEPPSAPAPSSRSTSAAA